MYMRTRLNSYRRAVLAAPLVTRSAGIAVIAIAAAVLAAWIARALGQTAFPVWIFRMNPVTAASLVLAGAALLLPRTNRASLARTLKLALGCGVSAIGISKLGQLAMAQPGGVDLLLFRQTVQSLVGSTLMAPNTAVALALLGGALMLSTGRRRKATLGAQLLAAGSLAVATAGLIAYAYGAIGLIEFTSASAMAFQTAVALASASIGVLWTRPSRALTCLITNPTLGGVLARRLLPVITLTTVALGGLRVAMGSSKGVLEMQKSRPVMLLILDGWGWRDEVADNAIRQARIPNFDSLWNTCPHAFIHASGRDVGLPDGQMGNSEVGHLNIGAGRVVMQDLPRISAAIADGEIKRAPALLGLTERLRQTRGTCHLFGLVSPGGVHSHQDHALALAKILAVADVPVVVHAFTDGRDTPPRSAGENIARFSAALPPSVPIATVCGRYYAMDRDHRWDRVARAYNTIANADGPRFPSAGMVIADAYANNLSDEFISPAIVGNYRGMRDGDGLLCFNFRADRVREILAALLDPAFSGFPRPHALRFVAASGMTEYSEELDAFMQTIFPPNALPNVLGRVVSDAGRTQLRMAESEKYPHVTYFLNGGEETRYPGEDRILVSSPKVATYDLQPEMSAPELTDKVVDAIGSAKYDLIVLNYANPDMVGHTGSLKAAIKAVQAVDIGLGRIADAIRKAGGALLVTADHGNCEMMCDPETGGPHTSHTTNPVPLILMGAGDISLAEGRLADVAPTLLELMELPKPAEMTGVSLLRPPAIDKAH